MNNKGLVATIAGLVGMFLMYCGINEFNPVAAIRDILTTGHITEAAKLK